MGKLEIGERCVFTTLANCSANYTGIDLEKGSVYDFEVFPPEQTWRDGWLLRPFTADGRPISYLGLADNILKFGEANWFSLIGSVDNSKPSFFFIGTKLSSYMPSESGELVTFANDVPGFYRWNNKGSMSCIVKRIM